MIKKSKDYVNIVAERLRAEGEDQRYYPGKGVVKKMIYYYFRGLIHSFSAPYNIVIKGFFDFQISIREKDASKTSKKRVRYGKNSIYIK